MSKRIDFNKIKKELYDDIGCPKCTKRGFRKVNSKKLRCKKPGCGMEMKITK